MSLSEKRSRYRKAVFTAEPTKRKTATGTDRVPLSQLSDIDANVTESASTQKRGIKREAVTSAAQTKRKACTAASSNLARNYA